MMSRSANISITFVFFVAVAVARGDAVIPHGQSKPPGPALTPEEAIKRMTVPDGFAVELVASEPDIVNPVAMTFDEKGRIWITESLEYPRRAPGKGRDRIKVLEDTDGDGRADKTTIFADGLNIPSGIAVGYGGVWVGNAPDILFLQDADGDGQADRSEVIVTGFGRDDTHELPNSLTWGPDGWLYGLNGVFNHCHVRYPESNPNYTADHPGWKFTCAVFRINPRTREFDVFAEGTSNPWGIAWDPQGSMFLSACVIDHLWHITESGYYHRQAGAYPPFTWKIESIVEHKHQKAAYCGIHYFDSDAYPEQYRGVLYMGNIHGNCINADVLERRGSTYFATPRPDILSANDAWFMPVSQKTGPDGCLYVLDWYDRYHCYQDANRDPQGIDRLKGRLYRLRYNGTPRAPQFDLTAESDDRLIERLHSANVYFRDIAQRLLAERNNPASRERLQQLVLDDQTVPEARMHALWSLIGTGSLSESFHRRLLEHADAGVRAWGVRAAGNSGGELSSSIAAKVAAMASDESAEVRLQVAIAAPKLAAVDTISVLVEVLHRSGDDRLIPHIVWQNLHPLLETQGEQFAREIAARPLQDNRALAALIPRALDRLLMARSADAVVVASFLSTLAGTSPEIAGDALRVVTERVQSGELDASRIENLRAGLGEFLGRALEPSVPDALRFEAILLSSALRSPEGIEAARGILRSAKQQSERRLAALETLISVDDPSALPSAREILSGSDRAPQELRARVLAALGQSEEPEVATSVLAAYPRMEPELQPKAIELLTQRTSWAKALLHAVGEKTVPADALNVNQVRKLLSMKDSELVEAVRKQWGTLREGRNPEREKVVAEMRGFLQNTSGDPQNGRLVYNKVCGQCHKLFGEGQDVGPDITSNGRGSFEQLLSNVFDPSLVIGAGYQGRTVVTTDGRVLTGLAVEDSPQRIVLKVQGGKLETVPRDQVEITKVSELSLMPEDLEKQLKPQEIADLFSYLTLTAPPGEAQAERIPGAPVFEPSGE